VGEPQTELAAPAVELITGAPAKANPGDEAQVKDPFEPYGIGPPEHAIAREQLSREERVALDRTRNADPSTLEAYRQAVLQRSASVTAIVAARQLGVDNLASVGVVP
jgi:hypothetical protein